jgi:hypothetical protein
MAQPDYVPTSLADRVRKDEVLPPALGWRADRPGDQRGPDRAEGRRLGQPSPDGGYGLKLARSMKDRLQLTEGIEAEDAVAGCFQVGTKRAALFGRAPVIHDLELAFTLWGFLGSAPADLVAARKPLFAGCAHSYGDQRDICDAVPDATLRLTPAAVRERLPQWRSLLALPS